MATTANSTNEQFIRLVLALPARSRFPGEYIF